MPFSDVSSRVSFPDMEQEVLRFWRDNDIFRRSMREREGGPVFTFFEGPPTANGAPGVHHVLARVFKDVIPRFKTMQGYHVPRKGGWDTHGLPVELAVEAELNLSTKREIEAYGIAKFNEKCKESVFRYVQDWESLSERIAFWVDMDDPYVTYSNEYIESGWWIFNQLWDKSLIYQGYRVTPHCPRCVTSLSSHEVALGYKDDAEDPSVHVKFRIADSERARSLLGDGGSPAYLLAWTTTPWTLPGNTGLAVAVGARYVIAEGAWGQDGRTERLIIADALTDEALEGDYTIVGEVSGRELVGLTYEPLFDYAVPDGYRGTVVAADFVLLTEGTGIVHIAPAYGAEDLSVGRAEGLPVVHTVNTDGEMLSFDGVPWSGVFFKDADPAITADLDARGHLLRGGRLTHTYPFCWRCDAPLLYYAKESWYIRTTALKDRLISANREVGWVPEHIGEGRFGEWLQNNVDWALSRERYWGTPIPLWLCEGCGDATAIGSTAQLAEQASLTGYSGGMDLHRPFIDDVTFACAECGGTKRRIPEVMDAWYDSGAMPIAQWHYPFENVDVFEQQQMADYICEGVDQTRGWFYTLHALAVLLFDRPAYRNVLSLGHILDEAGEKMSKSRGNVVEPWEILDSRGADALRWYMYTASTPGNARRFSANLVGDTVRRFLLPLWNTYSFFVTYANVDGFDPVSTPAPAASTRPLLDRWLLSRLQGLIGAVTNAMERYEVMEATHAIETFVDELSTWYVRRNRRRFWKSDNDSDKAAAYHTLYEALTTLSRLLAPFTPFVAEHMHRNLVASLTGDEPESVHLAAWPAVDDALRDEETEADVRLAMRLSSLGRAVRARAQIKVRQPLQEMLVLLPGRADRESLGRIQDQLLEELNVKGVRPVDDESIFLSVRVRPNLQNLGRRLGADLPRLTGHLDGVSDAERNTIAARVRDGQTQEVAGFSLAHDDLLVDSSDREGFISGAEGIYTVALNTEITPSLEREGVARELVRHLQELRRTAGLDVSDRITAYIAGDGDGVAGALTEFGEYVRQETLSVDIVTTVPGFGVPTNTVTLDETAVTIGVEKVSGSGSGVGKVEA